MTEMIDREALKKAIDTWDRFYYVPLQGVKRGCSDDYTALVRIDDILHCIDNMPSATVQPVKHGYWKEEEPRVLKCSVCGEYAPMNYLGQNCIDSRYCPWCGARMDLKDGDTNG